MSCSIAGGLDVRAPHERCWSARLRTGCRVRQKPGEALGFEEVREQIFDYLELQARLA